MRRSISPVNTVNTPSIASDATALASANVGAETGNRRGWSIQNLGTNTLFVRLASGASTTVFHIVLKGGTGNDDGLGGSTGQTQGAVYQGEITIAGTSPRYTVLEMT